MFTKIILLAVLATLAHGSAIINAIHHPQPYKFGYSVKDHHGEQHREEAGNGAGVVAGSYGFVDDRGVVRQVNYVADHAGFRAQVKTNEPGTANQNPAAVHMISNAPYAHVNNVPYAHVSNAPYAHGAVLPYVPVPKKVYATDAFPVDPVIGHGMLGHGHGVVGLGHAHGYGLGHGHNVLGHGGALGYSGLLGYGVNYASPLYGGAIRGYDSRVVPMI